MAARKCENIKLKKWIWAVQKSEILKLKMWICEIERDFEII